MNTNTSKGDTKSNGRPQRGRKSTPSLRQDGYATRSCPPGGDATGNTKNKAKAESTKNRLATQQLEKQDVFHQNKKDRKEENKTRTQQNNIRSGRSYYYYSVAAI